MLYRDATHTVMHIDVFPDGSIICIQEAMRMHYTLASGVLKSLK